MEKEYTLYLPKLGESLVSATIVQWLKKEGDQVAQDESLLEVATDKVNSEIPSPVAGTLKKILVPVDEEVLIGAPIAILSLGEAASSPIQEAKTSSPSTDSFFSPAVLELATQHHLSFEDLKLIPGTGKEGRLSKKDVQTFLQNRESPFSKREDSLLALSPLRKAINKTLSLSAEKIPQASLVVEIDASSIVAYLAKEKERILKDKGIKLSITSFVAKAIALAIPAFPLVNSSFDKEQIVQKSNIHLGIAISVENGLVVPVIKNCQQLSLLEIAQSIASLALQARTKQLSVQDLEGGTLTLTNFGISGIPLGIPLIRYPEAVILGMGAIQKKVVVVGEDAMGIRSIMNLCLTFDHRIFDGMYGCNFLTHLKQILEKGNLFPAC